MISRRLAGICIAVATATSNAAPARLAVASTCEAKILGRKSAKGAPRFGFVSAGTQQPIKVFAISVSRGGTDERICHVRSSPGYKFRPLEGDWTYGTVPPGFLSDGCSALAVGEVYQIRVVGSCLGLLRFRLERGGRIAVL